MLSFLGLMLFLLAGIDAGCLLLGWSLTDYSWSPLVFGTLGFVLVTLEALERDSNPSTRSGTPAKAWAEPRAGRPSQEPAAAQSEA